MSTQIHESNLIRYELSRVLNCLFIAGQATSKKAASYNKISRHFLKTTLFFTFFFFFSQKLVNRVANVWQSYGFSDEQTTPACIMTEILTASFSAL